MLYIGACRDFLLFKPVNDLDIIHNTRELNKIHLQHLQKYHSSKENQGYHHSCILWNIYLNKFGDSSKKYDDITLKEVANDEEKKTIS